MKKVIFATIVALLTATSVNAQRLCSNCTVEQNARLENGTFSPSVFNPVVITTSGKGTQSGHGYIEKVQVNSTTTLRMYVYMRGADGRFYVELKKGEIWNRPSYWPDEFMVDGEYDPQTLKYYVPKEISFRMDSKAVMQNGKVLQNPDGSPVIEEEKITISF